MCRILYPLSLFSKIATSSPCFRRLRPDRMSDGVKATSTNCIFSVLTLWVYVLEFNIVDIMASWYIIHCQPTTTSEVSISGDLSYRTHLYKMTDLEKQDEKEWRRIRERMRRAAMTNEERAQQNERRRMEYKRPRDSMSSEELSRDKQIRHEQYLKRRYGKYSDILCSNNAHDISSVFWWRAYCEGNKIAGDMLSDGVH